VRFGQYQGLSIDIEETRSFLRK